MPKKARRKWSAHEKAEMVQQFHASGLSKAEFGRRMKINPNVLRNWLKKEQEPSPKRQAVVPVRVKRAKAKANAPGFEVVLRGGRVIRVTGGFDQDLFVKLVAALERR